MQTKDLKEENTVQEPKCPVDHKNTLLLITRFQGDGTQYSYCNYCGWVDIYHAIQSAIKGREKEIVRIIKKHKVQRITKLKSMNPLKEILRRKSIRIRMEVINELLSELSKKEE